MNKTYNMEDIMSLFYRKFFLESETIISKEQREKLIEEFKQYIEKRKTQREQLVESFKEQGNEEAIKELDAYDGYANLTEEQKVYMDPYRMFDFVPLETMLRDVKCDGVYERKLQVQGLNKKYIDLVSNKEVTAEELEQRGGKYVIITSGMEQGVVDFTITEKGQTLNTTFRFIPKLQLFCQPKTEVQRTILTRVIDNTFLVCRYAANDITFPFVPDSTTLSEANKERINKELYKRSINDGYFARRTVDKVFSELSLSAPGPSIIIPPETMYTKLNPIEQVAYFAMLQNSSSKELQEYYSKTLEAISYNYATLSNVINQKQEENFKKYYPTASEITKYREFESKEYAYHIPEQASNKVELNTTVKDTQSQHETQSLPNNSETKTAKQIRESSEILKQMQSVGISLSPEQEQIIYIGEKLNSEEFKEFQAKRGERLKRQQEIREKNQRENAEKEARQNSESNNRKSVLIDLKGKLEALEDLKAKFPSLVSEEQNKFINEMKEFFMMYEQENTKEHEVDTGMSEESRAWYQEHYKSR